MKTEHVSLGKKGSFDVEKRSGCARQNMASEFKDQATVHFLMGEDGNLYVTPEPVYDPALIQATAVIDRIDRETNTIWFSTPLPEHLKAKG